MIIKMNKANTNNYHRKKEPEKVRARLMKATAQIILKKGVQGLTLDEAAHKGGVSKGGLLHHFPNKQALLNGIFDDVLEKLKKQIHAHMQTDPNPHARFTRAYLAMNHTFEKNSQGQLFMILTLAMMTNVALRKRWLTWFEEQLSQSTPEEKSTMSWIIRFASDGLWLSDLTQTPKLDEKQRMEILQRLIEMSF